MIPERFLLQRTSRQTRDTWTLTVGPLEGDGHRVFAPGQFNMLWAYGVGEVAISISGDPSRPGPYVHTIRAVGAVTQALCRLRRSSVLGVRGPFGRAWPLAELGGDILLVAGGIGLAPLRPVLRGILAARRRYGRVVLLVGTRTPGDLLYRREIARWQRRPDLDVRLTVDSAPPDWRGDVGVVTDFIRGLRLDSAHTTAMICGPEIMMHHAIRSLLEYGLSDEQIYVSLERNMKCAIGLCGHCQYGPAFICKDGPVFRFDRLRPWFGQREL